MRVWLRVGSNNGKRNRRGNIFRRICRLPSKWRQLGEGNWSPAFAVSSRRNNIQLHRIDSPFFWSILETLTPPPLCVYTSFFIPLLSLCPHWRNASPFSRYTSHLSLFLFIYSVALLFHPVLFLYRQCLNKIQSTYSCSLCLRLYYFSRKVKTTCPARKEDCLNNNNKRIYNNASLYSYIIWWMQIVRLSLTTSATKDSNCFEWKC